MPVTEIFIVYYAVAAVSGLCSIFVVATLFTFGSLKTTATQLLLYLHLTLLLEEFTTIPYAFNGNRGICTFIAWLHFYSGYSNAISTGLLVISYRYCFMEDTWNIMKVIHSRSVQFILLVPLVTLLPFITNSYSNDANVWCLMETNNRATNIWAFSVFYIWAWLILIVSTAVLGYTMYQVYTIDKEVGKKLFSTTGLYAAISIFTWIPRTAARFANFNNEAMDNEGFVWAYFPMYFAGMMFTLVFMREKKALLLFERMSDWTLDLDNPSVDASFSWESRNALIDQGSSSMNSNGSSQVSSAGSSEKHIKICTPTNKKRGMYSPLITREEEANSNGD